MPGLPVTLIWVGWPSLRHDGARAFQHHHGAAFRGGALRGGKAVRLHLRNCAAKQRGHFAGMRRDDHR
jgi:hypothetical protein